MLFNSPLPLCLSEANEDGLGPGKATTGERELLAALPTLPCLHQAAVISSRCRSEGPSIKTQNEGARGASLCQEGGTPVPRGQKLLFSGPSWT